MYKTGTDVGYIDRLKNLKRYLKSLKCSKKVELKEEKVSIRRVYSKLLNFISSSLAFYRPFRPITATTILL